MKDTQGNKITEEEFTKDMGHRVIDTNNEVSIHPEKDVNKDLKQRAREMFDERFKPTDKFEFGKTREEIKSFIDTVIDLSTKQAIKERDKNTVEIIKKQRGKYKALDIKEMGGWADEIKTCNKIISLITNRDDN